ncbi:MAG: 3-isopropylmalate dehydratase large subunit [Candidatus Lokiarchaeota archaeon]|nr:3-isopropylmalate dehydratase large subunit [Candidatus Lokiarchaeota archaeon]
MATISEKILAAHCRKDKIEPGEIINAEVDTIMVHEMLGMRVIDNFNEIGIEKIQHPERVVALFDHWIPANTVDVAIVHKSSREFIKKQGIKNYFGMREGICHQVIPEKGFVWPGALIVGTDSHTCTYGAFGAFSTGIGSTDCAILFAEGELWFKVPETIKFNLTGKISEYIYGKDLILKLITDIGVDGATYKAIEFAGEAIKELSIDSRMTMCNMAIEMGGKAGIVEADKKTDEWLKNRVKREYKHVSSDPNSIYDQIIDIDISKLEPQVAKPHSPGNAVAVGEVAGTKIDQCFIGSCTNGRMEDLRVAAKILKGKTVHQDVRLIICPASKEVYFQANKEGLIEILMQSGAVLTHSTCGPCLGIFGMLAPKEVSLSSSNRNFIGRQGSRDAEIYLSSAAVVAASALKGEITDPRSI